MKKIKIGIDARFIDPKGSGLSKYSINFIESLENQQIPNNYHFYILLRKEAYDEYEPKNSNFHKILADYKWYSLKEQLLYPFLLYRNNFSLMFFCHLSVPICYFKKQIILIPDLILLNKNYFPFLVKTTFDKIMFNLQFFLNKILIKTSALKASRIITISKFSKRNIENKLKVPNKKISVIYPGINLPKNNIACSKYYKIVKNNRRESPFLLYVGNAYPHKNLQSLCLAFKKIKNNNLNLVLVGKESNFYEELMFFCSANNIKNVYFLGYVPDEELADLYKKSALFVFPSLIEGFGLPPLEALLSGLKVATSNVSSMPEVLGNYVFYFNPKKIDDIAQKIEFALMRNNKIINKSALINKFNWTKNSERTYDIILKELS